MPLFSWLSRVIAAAPPPVASDPRVRRVLVTGAAGNVAQQLLPLLRPVAAEWRMTDARTDVSAAFGDIRVQQLGPGESCDGLFDDVDAVVHLSGQSKPASPDVLQMRNVDTLAWLLEQMQQSGITRLVHASSMHVMGRYRRDERVTPDLPPRPSDAYGASKLETERLIAHAADTWGLCAFVLRMGHVTTTVSAAEPGNWLATDDLARLVHIGVHGAPVGMTTVHAVTPHRGDDMGQSEITARFGMRWRTDAPTYRDAMQRIAQWYGEDAIAREFRGGVFASGRA